MPVRKRVAVMISGRGSNMAALIDACSDPSYPAEIVRVLSDTADVAGLALAEAKGITTEVVERRSFAGKQEHEAAVDRALAGCRADVVALAGYMRLLTPGFVDRWAGRMVNIHPSLLPLFRGLDTHARAIAAGVRIHGCSVHFVTAETDGGPIIAQAAVPVLQDDTADALAARVLKAEHRLYPMALKLVCEGRATMSGGRVVLSAVDDANASRPETLIAPHPLSLDLDLERLARFTP